MTDHFQEFKGIVLFVRKHKEKDALIKIFTKEYGKRMFFIRNFKNPNHPLKAALLPFTSASYVGRIQESGLSFLQDSKSSQSFRRMQEDVQINAYATYLCNLADAAVHDGVVVPELFDLLQHSLEGLNEGHDAEVLVNIFEMRLLHYFGVHPNLGQCVLCGRTQDPFDYSFRYNGVLCSEHWDSDSKRMHLPPATVYFARLFQQIQPQQIASVKLKAENKAHLRRFIDELYDSYVGIHLKSKTFLEEMKKWESSLSIPVRRKRPEKENGSDS